MKGKVLRTIRNIFDGLMIFLLFITTTVYALPSDGVIYDNSTSGSSATNVNDALNDLYSKLNDKQNEINNINNIGTAGANHILSGYTAYVKGKTITGSIPNKGATTYTPGTANQTIGVGSYISGVQTIKGDANLVAVNIAKGKSIFGVAGSYTSDANAVAGNILNGKTAYVNGNKITGTIPTLETVATNSTGDVSQANATGITSGVKSKDDTTSYLYLGIPKNTYTGENLWIRTPMTDVIKQLPNKAAATYTPGTTNQTIASGQYLSGIQTIKGDANLIAANIAKGKSIFGVSGTYTSDANAVAANILKDKTAYVNGSKITGSIASKAAATYTPGTSNQTIASGQYLSGAQTIKGDANLVARNIAKGKTIFGVSGSYTSDATATAADIKSGKTAYVNGSKITGTSSASDSTFAVYVLDGAYTSYTQFNLQSSANFTVSGNVLTCKKSKTYTLVIGGNGSNGAHSYNIRYNINGVSTAVSGTSYIPHVRTETISMSAGDTFSLEGKNDSGTSSRFMATLY